MAEKITYNWQNKTILIVEDEETNYMFLHQVLRRHHPEILWVTNGEDAVETCNTNPDIDLVLMDIKMPKMSGTMATEQIKKTRPNLPIIVQTAYALVSERQQIIESGCDEYITKPIRIKELLELVDKYI